MKLCLYPFEMVSAAKELQNGGNEQSIFRLMEEVEIYISYRVKCRALFLLYKSGGKRDVVFLTYLFKFLESIGSKVAEL